jgi:hypothetical protein
MEQEFITMAQLLETGTDLVSPHVRWLLRHAMLQHCSSKAISQISYCKDIPVDAEGNKIWAETFSATRSVAINLEQHVLTCAAVVETDELRYTSIRALIIRELVDSAVHEAHHLKCSLAAKNFANSNLEEEEARKIGMQKSWESARKWDADIYVFGPVIDTLLETWIGGLKAEQDATEEEIETWKDLQVFMWDHKLAFYNPELDQECGIRDAFEAMAKNEDPWIETPKQFLIEEIKVAEVNLEDVDGSEAPEAPVVDVPTAAAMEDIPPENEMPILEGGLQEPVIVPPPPPETPLSQEPAVVIPPPPVAPTIDKLAIHKTLEGIMRVMFVHVMSKCGFTTEGGYNNPAAVLETISVAHIEGAAELMTHYDTATATGVYSANVPCLGQVKGMISEDNLPYYRFYLKIGGQLYKRSFMPQNPNKLDINNCPTTWAQKAQEGTKIMMLSEKGIGNKAHIILAPNTPFGQEEFHIWGESK